MHTRPCAGGRVSGTAVREQVTGMDRLLDPINIDTYYRGLAAERLQELGDRFLALSQEAEQAGAHEAAWHLSDLATELLDMGLEVGGQRTPPA